MPAFSKLWSKRPHVKGEEALLDAKVYKDQAPSTCLQRFFALALI